MRNSMLTYLFAVVGPFALASVACFVSTEGERYDTYDSYGTGGEACPVGAPSCHCTNSGNCDDGLECVEMLNTCVVPDDCDVGAPGCECTAGGTCDPGLICKETYCVSDSPCLPDDIGSEGCQCTGGGGCDNNLECLSGLCVDTSGLTTGGPMTTTGEGSTGPMRETDSTGSADATTSGSDETGSTSGTATDSGADGGADATSNTG